MKQRTTILFLALCQPRAGSRLLAGGDAVFASLDCARKPLPFIVLEQNTLAPSPAKPGSQLLHHMVYAFCPAAGGKADTGVLTRSLYFNGRQVFSDATRDFALTPGRVAVDAVISVPQEAPPGTYVYAVEYVSNAEAQKRKLARTLTLDEKLDLVLVK